MEKIVFRTRHSPRLLNLPTRFPSVGRTKSEFKESCDINYILKKYLETGLAPVMSAKPAYLDCTSSSDFMEAQNLILEAEDHFLSLPSSLRKRFDNDPSKFLAFMEDPSNESEMVELGLIPEPDSSFKPAGSSEASPAEPSPQGSESEPSPESSPDS